MKKGKTKHIYSLEIPNDVFEKASKRQDITKHFIEMVRSLKEK